jgi:hypothetical protein
VHIYIDESGIFSNPAKKPNVASVVAALVIPSQHKVRVFTEFEKLSANWPHVDGEIKGRALNERQITATAKLLQKYNCVVEMNVIDIGIHTDDELDKYQKQMCDQIAGWATKEHSEEFKKLVEDISAALQEPKNQVFVELFLLTLLIPRVLSVAVNFYARHIPKELKAYHWVIDAKDKQITDYEDAWSSIILTSIEHQTKQTPLIRIENGDYSYLEPYFKLPEDLVRRAERGLAGDGDKAAFNVTPIMEDLKFLDSKDVIGLQLADIVANASQRALNGKLPNGGYEEIGGLMVKQQEPAIRIIRMDPTVKELTKIKVESPLHGPINKMLEHTKALYADAKQEEHLARTARRRNKKRYGYDGAFNGIAKPRK